MLCVEGISKTFYLFLRFSPNPKAYWVFKYWCFRLTKVKPQTCREKYRECTVEQCSFSPKSLVMVIRCIQYGPFTMQWATKVFMERPFCNALWDEWLATSHSLTVLCMGNLNFSKCLSLIINQITPNYISTCAQLQQCVKWPFCGQLLVAPCVVNRKHNAIRVIKKLLWLHHGST